MERPYIIFNPAAGSAKRCEKAVERLKQLSPKSLRMTRRRGDAEKWARRVRASKPKLIIVAGGDGTLNEVVNGLGTFARNVHIGIVPLGTGNDFARTLGLPARVDENIDLIRQHKTTLIDLVRVRSQRSRYFVNVSTGGFSGIVDSKITPQIKQSWGPLAYIRGAAAALTDLHYYKTQIVLDDRERLSEEVLDVVIANGRYVAGGLPIAPEADPSDGKLEVILVPKTGATEMALLAAEIALGRHLSNNATIFRRAKKIAVRSRPGMCFNVDGELIGNAPAVFEVMPRALNFITP
jgi:diacylglycerol kinase (ATP)